MPRHFISQLVKVFSLSFLLIGCRAPQVSTSTKTRHIDTAVVALVCNQPFRFEMPEHEPPTILSLFQIRNTRTDSVSLQFDDPRTLRLTYKDSSTIKQNTFTGRFTERGFKVIFSHEKKEIPPFIPILIGKYDINYITLALDTDNNLVIKKKWKRGGNLFIVGFRDSGTRKSYFTILGPQ